LRRVLFQQFVVGFELLAVRLQERTVFLENFVVFLERRFNQRRNTKGETTNLQQFGVLIQFFAIRLRVEASGTQETTENTRKKLNEIVPMLIASFLERSKVWEGKTCREGMKSSRFRKKKKTKKKKKKKKKKKRENCEARVSTRLGIDARF
jgi:hypothetical protein